MSEYTVRPITYTAGYLTAYGAAKQGGYTGTYEEFCAAIAGLEGIVEDLNNFSVVVSTLAAGSSATASYADGVLTLGIPKGDKGDQGDQGIPGEVQDDIIADEFSSSTAYTKGTMVMKESVLYRFTADHAAGAWTGSDAETVQIGEELTGINEDVSDLKEKLSVTATEETGQAILREEEIDAVYTQYLMDTLDRLFTNMPQDLSLQLIVDELVAENSLLDQLAREITTA